MEFEIHHPVLFTLCMIAIVVVIAMIIATISRPDPILQAIKDRGPSATITLNSDGTVTEQRHKSIIPVDDYYYCTGCTGAFGSSDRAYGHECNPPPLNYDPRTPPEYR